MKILFIVAAIVTALGLGTAYASHYYGIKWKGHAPVTVRLVDKTPASWDGAVTAAADSWSLSTAIDYVKEDGAENCTVVSGAVVICARNDGPTFYAALTTWGQRGNSYTAVLIVVNTYYLPNPDQHAICQELGHALGLDHQDASDSCMGTNWGALYPNAHDFEELEIIY
jgi:hypothetical protein